MKKSDILSCQERYIELGEIISEEIGNEMFHFNSVSCLKIRACVRRVLLSSGVANYRRGQ